MRWASTALNITADGVSAPPLVYVGAPPPAATFNLSIYTSADVAAFTIAVSNIQDMTMAHIHAPGGANYPFCEFLVNRSKTSRRPPPPDETLKTQIEPFYNQLAAPLQPATLSTPPAPSLFLFL